MRFFLGCVLSLLLLVFALWLGAGVFLPQQERDQEYTVQITPVEFFSGELKRLKPHLEFQSAVCFKIKTQGAYRCVPEVELWCDGERVDKPKYGATDDERSDEVSFTILQVQDTDGDKATYRAAVGGVRTFARVLQIPTPRRPSKVAFGPVPIEKPIALKPGVGSAVVWAMGGGDGVDLAKQEDVGTQLRKLPWVMVLRLRVEKKE